MIHDISHAVERVAPRIAAALEALKPLAQALETLQREHEKAKGLVAAEWLPHATSPFDKLDEKMANEEVGRVAEEHYRERWAEVRDTFIGMVSIHDVDDEARSTFREAAHAHGHGLYRVAPRLLYPELERVVRRELLRRDFGGSASLKELRRQVGGLPLSPALLGGVAYLALYQRLAEHLYEEVRSAEQLEKVRRDPVPNRHAAIHGLVPYGTMQNSLNALIMAEYVLGLVGALKAVPEIPPTPHEADEADTATTNKS